MHGSESDSLNEAEWYSSRFPETLLREILKHQSMLHGNIYGLNRYSLCQESAAGSGRLRGSTGGSITPPCSA